MAGTGGSEAEGRVPPAPHSEGGAGLPACPPPDATRSTAARAMLVGEVVSCRHAALGLFALSEGRGTMHEIAEGVVVDAVGVGVELWFASGNIAAVAVVGVAVVQRSSSIVGHVRCLLVGCSARGAVLGIADVPWCCCWLNGGAGLCQGARGAALSRRPGARGCRGRR
jgi:hypothetical protein